MNQQAPWGFGKHPPPPVLDRRPGSPPYARQVIERMGPGERRPTQRDCVELLQLTYPVDMSVAESSQKVSASSCPCPCTRMRGCARSSASMAEAANI